MAVKLVCGKFWPLSPAALMWLASEVRNWTRLSDRAVRTSTDDNAPRALSCLKLVNPVPYCRFEYHISKGSQNDSFYIRRQTRKIGIYFVLLEQRKHDYGLGTLFRFVIYEKTWGSERRNLDKKNIRRPASPKLISCLVFTLVHSRLTEGQQKCPFVDHQKFHVHHLPISDVDVTAETYTLLLSSPVPSPPPPLIQRQKCSVSRKSGTQMARYDLQKTHDKPNVDWVSRSTSTSQAGAQVSDSP